MRLCDMFRCEDCDLHVLVVCVHEHLHNLFVYLTFLGFNNTIYLSCYIYSRCNNDTFLIIKYNYYNIFSIN